MPETVLQELVLLWLASLGLCISSPPFSIVSCLTQLHLPLSNITHHKELFSDSLQFPHKKDKSTRTVKICNFIMLHDFMMYRVVNKSTHSSSIAPLSLCIQFLTYSIYPNARQPPKQNILPTEKGIYPNQNKTPKKTSAIKNFHCCFHTVNKITC